MMPASATDTPQPHESEELRTLFSRHGLRTTRQREAVYRSLCSANTHPTAEELRGQVHALIPDVSLATIYNTLEALVSSGLARRIPSPSSGGACRYDADTGEHVHLVLGDGRVMDVPMDLSRRILDSVPAEVLDELTRRTGIGLSGIKIELLGQ